MPMKYQLNILREVLYLTWGPTDATVALTPDALLTVAFHIPERPFFLILPTLSTLREGKFIYHLPNVLWGDIDIYVAFSINEGCPETDYEWAGRINRPRTLSPPNNLKQNALLLSPYDKPSDP